MSVLSGQDSSGLEDPLRGHKTSRKMKLGTGNSGHCTGQYKSEQVKLTNKTRKAHVRETSVRVTRS